VGEKCTAERSRTTRVALAGGMGLGLPVVNLELPAYIQKGKLGGG